MQCSTTSQKENSRTSLELSFSCFCVFRDLRKVKVGLRAKQPFTRHCRTPWVARTRMPASWLQPRGTTPWSTPRMTTPPSPGRWRMPPGEPAQGCGPSDDVWKRLRASGFKLAVPSPLHSIHSTGQRCQGPSQGQWRNRDSTDQPTCLSPWKDTGLSAATSEIHPHPSREAEMGPG